MMEVGIETEASQKRTTEERANLHSPPIRSGEKSL
jgi:hypothetical protein